VVHSTLDRSDLTQSPEIGSGTDSRQVARDISRGIVSLYARLFGRGPTHAHTHVADEFVLTILEETFTPAERTLVDAGRSKQVEETRRAFQEAVREDFVGVVEQATSRRVVSFMSQVDVSNETAIEFFKLESPDAGGDDGA
jgi:uncharacterized protein YbcI